MDRATAIRAGAVQAALVAVVSILLALLLPHSFFEDWGWLAGPGAWLGCAALTAGLLDLHRPRALLGAVAAGLPSLLAVAIGVHWLGAAIAVGLFGLWCGYWAERLPDGR